ncbi:phage tail tape measure protein [Kribbella sp. DT2]|uniref:phage tail tape measure protein n=1 Tax=Kribbella sp. DT2 TaxID=3393427 RepID=UPI003CED0193
MGGPIRISILADGKDAKKEFNSVADSATSSFGKIGAGLKSAGPPLAGIALGLGAVVVGGVVAALNTSEIKATLGAQLGLAGADAEKAGEAAGDLYKQGYGSSLQETADITKAAFENGLVSVKNTKEEITALGAQVATYSKLTGGDAVESTRAVAQMLKTNLAPSATAAFDLLTRGQQLGINKSEDLLDTFNEYGVQFQKLGLDGTASLGLINQLLQGGARDSDVAADAIKEFSIRAVDGSKATVAGFTSIGLNAETMAAKIAAGGPTAKTAFGEVLTALNAIEDPVKRNAAGVALFGTQFEDLGGAFQKADLSTAAASLGQVAGASDRVNAALSATPTAQLETLKRQATQTFVDLFVKYALPSVTRFLEYLNGPGKFIIATWALDASAGVLSFVDNFLAGLETMTGTLNTWGVTTLRTIQAVFSVVPGPVSQAAGKAADAMEGFTDRTLTALGEARGGIATTQSAIQKAKLTAKLNADKATLDQKLRDAKTALQDPKLTAERKAKLNADIRALQTQVNNAQAKLNSLKDKNVTVTTTFYEKLIGVVPDQSKGVRQSAPAGAPRTIGPPPRTIAPVPVINVYALTDGPDVGRRVVAALKEYTKMNGPLPVWLFQ